MGVTYAQLKDALATMVIDYEKRIAELEEKVRGWQALNRIHTRLMGEYDLDELIADLKECDAHFAAGGGAMLAQPGADQAQQGICRRCGGTLPTCCSCSEADQAQEDKA